MVNILLIGSDARTHVMAWKCAQSRLADRIYCAPGNPGIAAIAECIDIDAGNFDELVSFAKQKNIGLTLVGPEEPLVNGIVDSFRDSGLVILGPRKKAAILEGSKVFAKYFMKRYQIPTAGFVVFCDSGVAKMAVRAKGEPCVVKASGLAEGKGVVVAKNIKDAISAIDRISKLKGGKSFLVEELLEGKERSLMFFADKQTLIALPSVVDYKREADGNKGENTGGMGAYAPAGLPGIQALHIINKTIMGIRAEFAGHPELRDYCGVIYFGVLDTNDGATKALEYNVRLGHPEAQVALPLLKSDFVEVCLATATNKLRYLFNKIELENKYAVCVVVASMGYPRKYKTGYKIYGLEKAAQEGAMVFHDRTKEDKKGNVVTNSGRVLSVVGVADTLDGARKIAYAGASHISFGHKNPKKGRQFYRKDIALIS